MSHFIGLVIIGASGLVGMEFIGLIKNVNFLNLNIQLISNTTIGKTCHLTNLVYEGLDAINFSVNNIYVNCANGEQARLIKNKMSYKSILIDNSSEFRLDPSVPLCVPEINFSDFNSNVISNPNCSTILLTLLLHPFIKAKKPIKRVVVSTYQAASGAGKAGLEELMKQTSEYIQGKEITTDFWNRQYIFNTFVHDSPIENNMNCQEENKMINETQKILNNYNLGICATCIRVPVLRSHCESVNLEFLDPISLDEIYTILGDENKTIEILDDKKIQNFPTSLTSNHQNLVKIGHIRPDNSLKEGYGWNFWISGDQLLRGAAYNAFVILKKILKNDFSSDG